MAESQVRVLLIDDDSTTFAITRKLFEDRDPGRIAFEWAGSFDDGLAAIQEGRHDVYLVDHQIGG
jgi:CheY-like chemotaxis protein